MGGTKKLIKKIEEKKDMKLTPKRKKILRIFIESDKKHLSAEDIYLSLKNRKISIGLTTIYRTLDLFVKKKIITKLDLGDDTARYEFIYMEEERKHHHLICKDCGKVIETSGLLPEDLKNILLKKEGFKMVNHSLKIYGYCQECCNNENNSYENKE
ncbi:MAG: Fur family transcriptional regulator [bacterium]